eukprot:1831997-Alexandrium_andersonii.AAC.1
MAHAQRICASARFLPVRAGRRSWSRQLLLPGCAPLRLSSSGAAGLASARRRPRCRARAPAL